MRLASCILALLASIFIATGQDQPLSLDEIIRLSLARNGAVAAARLDRIGASERLTQVNAAFFPTITPEYNYTDNLTEFGASNRFSSRQTSAGIVADWLLWDSGGRYTNLRTSQAGVRSSRYDERQQRRSIIFEATDRYYSTLLARELVRVAQATVDRNKTTLEITQAEADAGAVARKEVLQAQADLKNSEVSLIQAQQNARVAEADLRETLGWEPNRPLPELVPVPKPTPPAKIDPLTAYEEKAIAERPDLKSTSESIRAFNYSIRQAEYNSRVSYQLHGSYVRNFQEESSSDRSISFFASIPLFDAGRSRSIVRETKASRDAAQARFEQTERRVRSDVESAYLSYSLNIQALTAASLALEAAQLNYEAATEGRKEGAGSLTDVINAQLALVQAETNNVNAVYNFYIANAQLQFVSGAPMAGELP